MFVVEWALADTIHWRCDSITTCLVFGLGLQINLAFGSGGGEEGEGEKKRGEKGRRGR